MKKGLLLLASVFLICGCSQNDLSRIRNIHTASGANIVCFGDSLTAGFGAGPGQDYPSLISSKVSVPVINMGRNGDTTAKGLARIDEVLKDEPLVVIVEFGSNDYLQSLENGVGAIWQSHVVAFKNLRSVVDRLQSAGAIVIIAGVRLNG